MRKALLLSISFLSFHYSFSQTGPGIAVLPTGTEIGLGFRSAKDTRVAFDARLSRAIFNTAKSKPSNFVSEVSVICRVVKLEKVRFNIGLGPRVDWNFTERHRYGLVLPVGVEAFPFPFQNAGLFFEVAPYFVSDMRSNSNVWGLRAASGFIFYFPTQPKKSAK